MGYWYLVAMSWVPSLILHGVFIFIYLNWCIFTMKNEPLWMLIVINVIGILFYYSMCKVVWIEPGAVSQEVIVETWKQWDQYLEQEQQRVTEQMKSRRSQKSGKPITEEPEDKSVVNYDDDEDTKQYRETIKLQRANELLEKPGKRFCRKCFIPKPPRTHHCSQCKNCWRKMDHHCQWVNNCVAIENYKYFFLMILYASIGLVFLSFSQYKTYKNAIFEETDDYKLVLIVLHFHFLMLMAILISGFTVFHLFLIVQNKTTLEYLEKKRDGDNYNKGLIKNIQEILGSNPLIWFLPI